MTTRSRPVSRWTHEGLERRGYKKCPFCWRHLVKIEQHVEAHRTGRIGPDGKRRDRAAEVRYAVRRRWVPRIALRRLAELPPDRGLLREVDDAADQEP